MLVSRQHTDTIMSVTLFLFACFSQPTFVYFSGPVARSNQIPSYHLDRAEAERKTALGRGAGRKGVLATLASRRGEETARRKGMACGNGVPVPTIALEARSASLSMEGLGREVPSTTRTSDHSIIPGVICDFIIVSMPCC